MKLLVAAMAPELSAFPTAIDGYDIVVTGPGKLNATAGLTEALVRGDYDEILVLGTSGTVDESITGTHDVAAAVQHDVWDGEKIIGNHLADSIPTRVETGREGLVVATGDHFVDTAEGAQRVRDLGATFIDMETYAYIWVAQRFGVPIRVVRIVSDGAEEDAFTTWDEVVADCSAKLWNWFQREVAAA